MTGKSETVSLRFRVLYFLAALPLLFMQPVTAQAGSLIIGNHASVATGSGTIELGCNDAEIAGALSGLIDGARDLTFRPGALLDEAQLGFSGDWRNDGPQGLNAGVVWTDGCGASVSHMRGNTDLQSLHIFSDSGREIRFDAAGQQSVSDSLILAAGPGQRLRLRADTASRFASLTLNFGASQLIDWVDVAWIDSGAGTTIASGRPDEFNSVRSGPVRNWFALAPIPVPTLSLASIALLLLLIGLTGLNPRRRRAANLSE